MSKTARIRLIIVDNHRLLVKGISLCFQVTPDISVIAEASNGIEAVEMSNRLLPDVILMDLLLPQMDGTAAARIIHKQNPRIKILIFTIVEDKALIRAALDAGAAAYISKDISIQGLVSAVRKVSRLDYVRD
jgi:DNA-binding NarL/FixJ family response regulator